VPPECTCASDEEVCAFLIHDPFSASMTEKQDTQDREHVIEKAPHQDEPVEDTEHRLGQDKDEPAQAPTYDTGVKAWLHVLGAFFLWFNTWYV
jgi:hypothetical protein